MRLTSRLRLSLALHLVTKHAQHCYENDLAEQMMQRWKCARVVSRFAHNPITRLAAACCTLRRFAFSQAALHLLPLYTIYQIYYFMPFTTKTSWITLYYFPSFKLKQSQYFTRNKCNCHTELQNERFKITMLAQSTSASAFHHKLKSILFLNKVKKAIVI